MDINVIYNEDCIGERGMAMIADGSVDMVLCDLPYGTTQNKWDSVIPMDDLWKHYERIVKPSGVIVLTAAQPFTSALIMSNPKMFKYCWVWDKKLGSGTLNVKKQPLRRHEDIVVFYGSKPTYNPQMTTGKFRNKSTSNPQGNKGNYGVFEHKKDNFNDQYYPTSILEFSNADRRNKVHPTQKPVALIEYLIRTYTNHGDVVLDNCIGSGTTAVACVNTGRNYIGFEMDKGYYDVAVKRVEDAKASLCPTM